MLHYIHYEHEKHVRKSPNKTTIAIWFVSVFIVAFILPILSYAQYTGTIPQSIPYTPIPVNLIVS